MGGSETEKGLLPDNLCYYALGKGLRRGKGDEVAVYTSNNIFKVLEYTLYFNYKTL